MQQRVAFVPPTSPGDSRYRGDHRRRGTRASCPLPVTVIAVTSTVKAVSGAVTSVISGSACVTDTVPAVTTGVGRPSLSRRARGPGLNPSLCWYHSLSNRLLARPKSRSTRAAPPATLELPSKAQLPSDPRLRPLSYPLRCARRVSRATEAAWPAVSTAPAVPRRARSDRDVHAVTKACAP